MRCQNTCCRGVDSWYVSGEMIESVNAYPKRRRSASADAALRAEIQRMDKLTMEERMRAALSMAERFPDMQGTPQTRVNDVGADE